MIKLFEKYNDIKDVKDVIFVKAIDTYDLKVIEFFIKRGYNINSEDALRSASFDDKTFRYFLEKGADINKIQDDRRLEDLEVQKALIDFGHEVFVHDIGFHRALKGDDKYSEVVDRFENINKYNL